MQTARKVKTLGGLTLASSLVWMVLVPSMSFAATVKATAVTLTPPAASQLFAGNTVTWTAQATDKGGTAEYQFFWTSPTTGTHHTTYRTNNKFTLTLSAGAYAVWVYALDKSQVTAKEWSQHVGSGIVASAVTAHAISAVTLTGSPTPTAIEPGTKTVNVTAKATAPNNVLVYYQFVVQNSAGKVLSYTPYSQNDTASVKIPVGVPVTVTANALTSDQVEASAWSEHVASQPLVYNVAAYGQPAQVTLSPATASLDADGKATDTVTLSVLDAEGNVVADYNGSVNVVDSAGVAGSYGLQDPSGVYVGAGSSESFAVTNGQATITVGASNQVGQSQTLSTSGLTPSPSGVNITYGSTTIDQVAATATQLSLSANPTALSVNSTPAGSAVTITEEDAAGNEVYQPVYVTVNLTGPGSFEQGAAETTETLYVDGSANVEVYGEIATAGTIAVTASSQGLTNGTVSIPAYVNTAPAGLKISETTGTASNGAPFTLYSVQLVDTNGNPITTGPNADNALSISANTSGGALTYWTVANGAPSAQTSDMTPDLTNGMYSFAVENTAVGTSNATITVTDTTENFSATAPYTYVVGPPAEVANTNTATQSYVESGSTYTVSEQLEDANGNVLTTSNVPVDFYFASNTASAQFPNAVSEDNSDYVVNTNGNGIASVNVTVPGASDSGSFVVDANVNGGTSNTGPTVTVEPAADYATQMAFNTAIPSSATAGTQLEPADGQTVSLMNAVGGAVNTDDQLQVTTSNPLVLEVGTSGNASTTVVASDGTADLPAITAGLAGTATITVTDLSNPSVKALTETVTVTAGAASKGTFYVGNDPLSSSNTLTVAASTPVAITLYNTDAAGDPVPVTTTEAAGQADATFSLNDPNGGAFRTSPDGLNTTTAEIAVGQEAVTLYYINATAGSYYGMTAALTSNVPTSVSVGSFTEAGSAAPYSYTSTVTVKDVNGNGVVGLTASDFTVKDTTATTTLTVGTAAGDYEITAGSTAGQYTLVIYESTSADTDGVSVTVNGVTGTGTL